MAKLYSKVSHMLDHSRSTGHLAPLVSFKLCKLHCLICLIVCCLWKPRRWSV